MDLPDLTTPTPNPSSYSPSDAPPTTPILGFLAYANAAGLKCHFPASPTGPPPPPDPPASSFKECLKNHAACIGGHALDGCCQFLPTPSFNPNSDPISLICAACGCHRNFHRPDNAPAPALLPLPFHPFLSPSSPPTPAAASASPLRPTPDPAPASPKKRKQRSKSKKKKKAPSPVASPAPEEESSGKRFRTKFSKEQKERMYQFSEKVGWKLQNADKEVVEDFCEEVGVEKEVLRIWMNNNKHTFGRVRKRSLVHAGAGDGSAPPPRRSGGGRGRAERPRLGSGNGGSPAASSC